MGRHSTFTPEIAAAICERLTTGEPLRAICRDEGMPAASTVIGWIEQHASFGEQYARAREQGLDALAEQCLDIADDEKHDWVMSKKGVVTDDVAIARAKLRVDTRKWLLSKMAPKRYGDRQTVEHEGGVQLQVVTGVPRGDAKDCPLA